MKRFLSALAAASAFALAGAMAPAYAADPTVDQIYHAANGGHLDDAQRMIDEVLQAHPNSARAHYIDAEVLAKEGKMHQASSELSAAEKIAPGLPFANADSVSRLKTLINRSESAPARTNQGTSYQGSSYNTAAAPSSGFPWGLVFAVVALVAFIAWAARFMTRRAPPGYASGGYGPAYPQGAPQGPYGPSYGPPGYAPVQQPGMGSQILGGLATGAALGAGVVAGEELVHHFTDGNRGSSGLGGGFGNNDNYTPFQSIPDTSSDDMGGSDFGISDPGSSWDDNSGGGGGGDWN